jgi:hypothetical protein
MQSVAEHERVARHLETDVAHVEGHDPARRVEVCALLDRSARRIVPLDVRYVGLEVPGDAFVLGYGLHYGERYRNLPVVVEADRVAVTADPDAYLGLYDTRGTARRGA